MTKKIEKICGKNFEKLKKHLEKNPKIIVVIAENFDADAVGGSIAIFSALQNAGFCCEISCACDLEKFSFLKNSEKITKNFDEKIFDTAIFVDCGEKKMTGFFDAKPRLLSAEITKINIDHHASNDFFGDINFVEKKMASATMVVFELLKKMEWKISPTIATALLAGIYGDTGSFMHQNTTPEVYFAAAELMRAGANFSKISKNLFRNYEIKTLKLWAKVLQNLHVTPDGAAIVGVEKSDYKKIGANREDLEGIIDFINSIPETKYSVLLSETDDGNVKASLRTRQPDVDVKALAEKFGGGGHVKASGFTIKKSHLQKDVKWKIVSD